MIRAFYMGRRLLRSSAPQQLIGPCRQIGIYLFFFFVLWLSYTDAQIAPSPPPLLPPAARPPGLGGFPSLNKTKCFNVRETATDHVGAVGRNRRRVGVGKICEMWGHTRNSGRAVFSVSTHQLSNPKQFSSLVSLICSLYPGNRPTPKLIHTRAMTRARARAHTHTHTHIHKHTHTHTHARARTHTHTHAHTHTHTHTPVSYTHLTLPTKLSG